MGTKFVVCHSRKGGVGKSTVAYEVARMINEPLVDLEWESGGVTRKWGYRYEDRASSPILTAFAKGTPPRLVSHRPLRLCEPHCEASHLEIKGSICPPVEREIPERQRWPSTPSTLCSDRAAGARWTGNMVRNQLKGSLLIGALCIALSACGSAPQGIPAQTEVTSEPAPTPLATASSSPTPVFEPSPTETPEPEPTEESPTGEWTLPETSFKDSDGFAWRFSGSVTLAAATTTTEDAKPRKVIVVPGSVLMSWTTWNETEARDTDMPGVELRGYMRTKNFKECRDVGQTPMISALKRSKGGYWCPAANILLGFGSIADGGSKPGSKELELGYKYNNEEVPEDEGASIAAASTDVEMLWMLVDENRTYKPNKKIKVRTYDVGYDDFEDLGTWTWGVLSSTGEV